LRYITGLGETVTPVAPPEGVIPGVRLIHAPSLWRAGIDGTGVTVGIVDTGADASHPALQGAILGGRNFTGGIVLPPDPDAWQDRQGHGTHVAVIIRQVAPGARLLIAKGLDDQGAGSDAGLAAAIDWLRLQGVDIISASWGGAEASEELHTAVRMAVAAGILFCAAAGNEGHLPDIDSVMYPARWDEPLAVAATMQMVPGIEGTLPADYSSAGPEVDVAAPGTWITSAAPGGGWVELSGTSMATPMVAGFAALLAHWWLRATGRMPTEPELVTLLLSHTRDIAGAGRDVLSGVGQIDASPLSVRHVVELTDGSPEALVDGEPVVLDVPARIEAGRFLVPFRAEGEALGAAVSWEPGPPVRGRAEIETV